jgi:uncharacterized repeat protein (TIGR01451 family)
VARAALAAATVATTGFMGLAPAGAAPGTDNVGAQAWAGGGTLVWEINDATGTAGGDPGWDLLNITGGLNITATAGNKFTIDLTTLTLANVAGPAANFDNATDYTWVLAKTTEGITGFDAAAIALAGANFQNPLGTGLFSVELANAGNDLVVRFVHPAAITVQPANASAECGTGSATFTVTATGTAPLSYQWRRGGTPLAGATGASLTINPTLSASAGSYDVVVSNAHGTATSDPATLTVVDTVAPVIGTCAGNQSIVATLGNCQATLADLTGSVSATDTCGGTVLVTQSPVAGTLLNLGANTVTFTAMDAAGNTATCQATITVNSSLTSVAVNSATICVGDSVTLTATSSAANPSYAWTPGGQTTASITVSPSVSTIYSVTVTDGTTGCSASGSSTVVVRQPQVFSNTGLITINDAASAVPYPSTINVSGLTATVCKVTVTLNDLSHLFPDDLDVLLVGPGGQAVLLMSDVGGPNAASGLTLTFDDAAAGVIPDNGPLLAGTYRPSNIGAKSDGRTDAFPSPAPVEHYVTNLTTLNNIDPNGTWSLYVVDDELVDAGQMANGWSLAITTLTPFADVAVAQVSAPNPVAVGSNLTFTVTVTNRGPAGAQNIVLTDAITGSAAVVSATGSQGSCVIVAGTVTCDLGVIDSHGAATVAIVVTPSAAGTVSSAASVASGTLDFVAANNTAAASATVLVPPVVVTQPLAQTICEGGTLTFTVAATGDGTLSYQWYRDGSPIGGATAATYTLNNATPANSGSYAVEVSNSVGGIRSAGALGTVNPTPSLSVAGATICLGQSATLTAVSSAASPSYLWSPGGATTASITVNPSAMTVYTVAVTDGVTGCGNSTTATVTVTPLTAATPLASFNDVCPGTSVTFSTTASGTPPFSYVWRKNGTALATTTSSLTIAAVAAGDGGTYTVEVTGTCGSVTNSGTLALAAAPVITAQPQNQTTPMGNGAAFSVTATGLSPTYQWQYNGTDIPGATSSSLAISNLALSAAGVYRVNVSNCGGTVTSAGATLIVTPIAGISFDFDSADQFTNVPYALINNDWLVASPGNGLILPPVTFYAPTGGVGVATGSGALDLIAGSGAENTIMALPVTYDFSLPGKRITASTMFKAKAPTSNSRSTQIGFLTATNHGINDNNPQAFMTVILQSTAQPALTYEMRHQRRSSGGGLQESVLTTTTTLTAGNWYRVTATFINTKDLAPSNYTAIGALQDMGPQGTTPGAVLLSFTSTTNTSDIVNFKNVYLGMRGFENTGIDYRDNIFANAATGPLTVVAPPASQTVLQGRRALLRALVDGDGPYTYQWNRNGAPLPGARSWKLLLPAATLADSGAQYTVTVTGPANTVTTDPATITVQPETLSVVSAGSVDGSAVGVLFSQPVDPVTAGQAANYQINGSPVIQAQVYQSITEVGAAGGEGARVLLTPSSLLSGPFTVTVQNVQDLSGNAVGVNNSAAGTVAGLTGEDVNPLVTQPIGFNHSFGPGRIEVAGGGADINGTADTFRFVHARRTGDFDVKVQVPFLDLVRTNTKAGLEARGSLDPFAAHVLQAATPRFPSRNLSEGLVRSFFNTPTFGWGNTVSHSVGFPSVWLRLRRAGNTFLRYSSANGTSWSLDGLTVQPFMPDTLYVGLAVTAGAQGNYATAQFENFGDFAGYAGATIAVTQQPANTNISAGVSATLVVGASASGGGIPAGGELTFTWQRSNGAGGWTNVPTAVSTNGIFSTGPLFAADSGAQYRAIVTAPGATSVTSGTATVTVSDTTAPTLAGAAILAGSVNNVIVTFSEPVGVGALVAGNYVVTNAAGVNMNVTSASYLWNDLRVVVLTTTGVLVNGNYGVRVSGVQDLGGTSIVTPAVRTFSSQGGASPLATGPVITEFYVALTNQGVIGDLVASARTKFGTPDFVVYSNVFGIHPNNANFPSGWGDHYGVRMYSYFVPPSTGNYKFYTRVDDYCQFLMNTNAAGSTNPAGAVVQITMTGNVQAYNIANSVTNFLNGGQPYYMEFRYKESTGGDGGTVAVRTDNTVPGQGEVITASQLAYPDAVAPASTPVALELYTGLIQSQNVLNGNINDLIAATNAPRMIATIPNIAGYSAYFGFNTNFVQINATLDNYYLRAYSTFVAPSNGLYKVWLRCDDSGQVWMNTNAVNSADPAGMALIGGLLYFTNSNYALVGQNVALTGGQAYYTEVRFREGTGGDGFSITFRAQSDPTIPPVTEVAPATLFSLPASLARIGPPRIAGLSTGPTLTVTEGTAVRFNAVGVNGAYSAVGLSAVATLPPLLWFKNGTPIFANGEIFTNVLTAADNGAVITCVATNPLGVATASTVVTVLTDTTPPALTGAVGNQYYDTVVVSFSEPVDAATAKFLGHYQISGLTVLSAAYDYDSRRRVSLRTSLQTPGVNYTVTVNGVKDLAAAGNTIAANSTVNFTAWSPGGGNALFVEIYTNILGTAVDNLVKDPKYMNNFADVSYYTNKFGVAQFGTSTGLDNYGARVSGYFMPPSNGLYRFYIRGDDGTQLFMNTNGPSSLGRTLIARSDGANSGTYENGTGNGIVGASVSPILTLTYGTPYYIEGFVKEGGGGDHMEVVLRAIDPNSLLPVLALPAPVATDIVPAKFFSAPGNPSGVQVTFAVALPAETSAVANDLVTLNGTATVVPSSLAPFIAYQWQRFDSGSSSFANIAGAVGATLTFAAAAADNNVAYRVIASVPGASATASTILRVDTDNVGPRIASAMSLDGRTISVCFTEPVEPASAGDEFAYTVNAGGAAVLEATARPDGLTALLVVDMPLVGTFTLDASGVLGANDGRAATGTATGTVKGFTALDVGGPTAAGSSFGCREGEIEVVAGGGDIWNNSDQGHLTLTPRNGDFDVRVRVESLLRTSADTITKAGLMIRETLEPGSRTLHALVNPPLWDGGRDLAEGGARMAFGGTTAAWTYNTNLAVGTGDEPSIPNAWVRVTRDGNTYRAYGSRDGLAWKTFATTHNTFSNTVYIGLATSAHNNGAPPTLAKYRNVYIPDVPTINTQPTPPSQTVGLHAAVAYSVAANNPPNSGAVRYQWRRNGVAIAGANSASLSIPDTGAGDSGQYTVDVGNDGGAVTSVPVLLTVNNGLPVATGDAVTAPVSGDLLVPAATLLGNDTDPEAAPLSIVAVSGVRPVTIGTNFNEGLLEGATVYGAAAVDTSGVGVDGTGVLRLTTAVGNSLGGFVTAEPALRKRVTGFTADFKLRITEGGPNEAADGFSFNFGRDLTLGTVAAAEEGSGTGLSFCVDNYRAMTDARAFASALRLKYRGIEIKYVQTATWNIGRYVPVRMTLTPEGQVTVLVDGTNVFGAVTIPWTPTVGRFGLYARTGGAYESTCVDDLSYSVTTLDTGRDFDLGGATYYGNAYLDFTTGAGGTAGLHLTDNVNNQAGSFIIPELTPGVAVQSFNASFKLRIDNGSGNAADGFSFNLAGDLPNAATGPTAAEEGLGTGLSVCVDNYPTGGTDAPSFKLKMGGIQLGFIKIPKWNSLNYIPVSLNLDADGTLDVVVDGTNVVQNLPTPYVPIVGRFGFFARTGGENQTHWIDDIVINVTTPGNLATYANNFNGGPGTVTLAGGLVTYHPPENACGADHFYYVLSDGQVGGTAVAEVFVTLPELNPIPPIIVTCAPNHTYLSATPFALPNLTGEVVASDNCYVVVTQSPVAGTTLPFGNTVVTFTATDGAGLTATCQATIKVVDPTPVSVPNLGFTPGGNFGGSFMTVPGLIYTIDYKNALTDTEWTNLTTIVGDGTTKAFLDLAPLPPTRFYRITVH